MVPLEQRMVEAEFDPIVGLKSRGQLAHNIPFRSHVLQNVQKIFNQLWEHSVCERNVFKLTLFVGNLGSFLTPVFKTHNCVQLYTFCTLYNKKYGKPLQICLSYL